MFSVIILRDYQKDLAAKTMRTIRLNGFAYLSVEVRVGKTLVALTAAKAYGATSVLFVTKKKAIPSIQKDFHAAGYLYRLTVTNYEQVKKLHSEDYDFVVADEAHSFGAFPRPSQRTQAMRSISFNKPIIFLSGTPAPESFSQMYHQFWLSAQSPWARYRNFYAWANDGYVNIKEVTHGQFTCNDYSDADKTRVQADIAPYMITYTQEQAGFECPVVEHFHDVYSPRIPVLCKSLYHDRVIEIEGDPVVADSPASLIIKMHQLSSGTVIGENRTHVFCEEKARLIKSMFERKRVAIFYKFQAERTILEKYFPDHSETSEEFQQGKRNVFLAQIVSGREGIALDTADAIIMFAIDFAAVSYWQARARLQTLHRGTPAEVHWFFTKGGIEKKVYRAVSAKRDFTLSFFMKNGAFRDA